MSKAVDGNARDGWTVLIRGRLADSRFRTVRRQGLASSLPAGSAAAWDAVSVHGRDPSCAATDLVQAPPDLRPEELPPQPVTFARSGVDFHTGTGELLLDAAERAGLDMPFSCTVGGCGECKQKLVSGEILLEEPNCLSAEEKAAGWRLMCVGRALSPLVIDA